MKEKGVVLVDVSPVAIYTPSEKIHRTNTKTGKPYWTKEGLRLKDYDKIVQQGWQHYAAPILHELRPKKVLFLGKKVVSAIQDSTIKLHAEYLGAEVLPVMRHPSDVKLLGKNYRHHLRLLRAYSSGQEDEAKRCQHHVKEFEKIINAKSLY